MPSSKNLLLEAMSSCKANDRFIGEVIGAAEPISIPGHWQATERHRTVLYELQ